MYLQKSWLNLASIPGVEIKGYVPINDNYFDVDPERPDYEEKLRKTEELRQKQKKFLEFAKENPESTLQFISGTKLALLESEVKFLEKLITIQKKGFRP